MYKKNDIFKFHTSGCRIKLVNIDHNDIVFYVYLNEPKRQRKGYSIPMKVLTTYVEMGELIPMQELDEELFTL